MNTTDYTRGIAVDGRVKYAPSRGDLGYLPILDVVPAPVDELHTVAVDHWENRDGFCECVYRQGVPRRFSKLRLYAAIQQLGKWEALETWLKSQTIDGLDAYTSFILAQDLSDDHPMFEPLFTAAKATLGVDDATADAILAAAEEPAGS